MLKHRLIPCLLLQNNGLVKTQKFSNPKYVGDPINAIRIFNEKEVDELIVIDIQASKLGQEPNYQLIEEFAGECFMPLCMDSINLWNTWFYFLFCSCLVYTSSKTEI